MKIGRNDRPIEQTVSAHARLLLLWSLGDELMTSNTSAVAVC
jgi:hypothetical protein